MTMTIPDEILTCWWSSSFLAFTVVTIRYDAVALSGYNEEKNEAGIVVICLNNNKVLCIISW